MTGFVFQPYDIQVDHDFLYAAHRETSAITFGVPFDDAKIDSELDRKFEVRDGLFLNGEMVGICDLSRRDCLDLGECGYVHFFYISPEHRSAGLGGLLIRHALCWCQENGLGGLMLRTGQFNTAAQRCYEKNGFIRVPALDRGSEWAYIQKVKNTKHA